MTIRTFLKYKWSGFDRFVLRYATWVLVIYMVYMIGYLLVVGWALYVDQSGWLRTPFGSAATLAGAILLVVLATLRYYVEIRERDIKLKARRTHEDEIVALVRDRYKFRPASIQPSQDE